MQDVRHKMLLAIGLGLLFVVGVLFLYISLFNAPEQKAGIERFVVSLQEGMLDGYGINALKDEGYIKSKFGFRLAFRETRIEPGAYKISPAMSAWEIARVFKEDPYMKWVVIPEGLRKEQIAELIGDTLSWTDQQKSDWVQIHTSMTFDEAEGVYFPDTYLIPVDEGLGAVADRLRAKFNAAFAPYLEEANKQNIRWPTLLKIASLVQREAAGKNDMPLIAGVLWNRLLNDQKLDIDATVQYARDTRMAYTTTTTDYQNINNWWAPITVADKKIDSHYNTYLYKGLPPHPIANPGIDAIEAVLFPEETDCFYYLHDEDGNIHCSVTYEGHQKNIEQYLR